MHAGTLHTPKVEVEATWQRYKQAHSFTYLGDYYLKPKFWAYPGNCQTDARVLVTHQAVPTGVTDGSSTTDQIESSISKFRMGWTSKQSEPTVWVRDVDHPSLARTTKNSALFTTGS